MVLSIGFQNNHAAKIFFAQPPDISEMLKWVFLLSDQKACFSVKRERRIKELFSLFWKKF